MARCFFYVLNENGQPVAEPDPAIWWLWMAKNKRGVCYDELGAAQISTVFLGMDFSFGEGPPVLWETLVFGSAFDDVTTRCRGSREQAEAMHARMVERVKCSNMGISVNVPAQRPPAKDV
jgi:hypothetical protein